MARIASKMIPLKTEASNFNLLDTASGNTLSLKSIKGDKATVIMFICNHCPFVIHINSTIVSIANTYIEKGVGFVAISSNDVANYPQDSPEKMSLHSKNENYTFPYLYDETQNVARAYDAACTPDFYIFDADLKLTYRGQFDDSRPGNGIPVTGKDIKHALDCLIANKTNKSNQKPSIGCSIKWKKHIQNRM